MGYTLFATGANHLGELAHRTDNPNPQDVLTAEKIATGFEQVIFRLHMRGGKRHVTIVAVGGAVNSVASLPKFDFGCRLLLSDEDEK
jgi:hypothetical protein